MQTLSKEAGPKAGNADTLPALKFNLFTRFEDAEALWRAVQKTGNYRVFQDFDWNRLWHQYLGAEQGIEPRIVVASGDDVPLIVFPLGLARESGIKKLVWLASDWNDYNAPVSASGDILRGLDIEDLWRHVCRIAGPADVLELSKQSSLAGHAMDNPAFLHSDILEDNNAHVLDLDPDEEALRNRIHSSKTWHGFKRKLRKMERDHGKIDLVEETDPDIRATVMRDMLISKERELRMAGKGNPFADPRAIEFLVEVTKALPHIARLFTIRTETAVVVTTICLQEKTNLLLYQTVYDPAYGMYSPGAILLHDIIFKAAEEGLATFDCSFGDDQYKRSICNRSIEVQRGILALTVPGRLYRLTTDAKLRARRRIKSNPKLYRTALAVNRKLTRAPASE